MIFEIQETAEGKTVIVETDIDHAWQIHEMLSNTYPNQRFTVGCWGAYENCVVFS